MAGGVTRWKVALAIAGELGRALVDVVLHFAARLQHGPPRDPRVDALCRDEDLEEQHRLQRKEPTP